MIIYRYISRQLLATTLAVSFILVLILVSGRFIKYMSQAADGRIAGEVLFTLMAYRLPEFLQMILPLGLFLGILLSYGRLYIENEMVVLSACGISQSRITLMTFIPCIVMMIVVASLSLYLAPWGGARSDAILWHTTNQSRFELLTPGRFHSNSKKDKVTYTEGLSTDRKRMENVFIAEDKSDKSIAIFAKTGVRRIDAATGSQYLELKDGFRYEGVPGSSAYRIIEYDSYQLQITAPDTKVAEKKIRVTSSRELLDNPSLLARAELQWRIALPILVPIVVLLAIPLSKVNPRQGRYLKLLPSILVYLSYLALLIACKSAIEKGKIPPEIGLWWVHVLFFCVAILSHSWPWLRMKLKQRQREAAKSRYPKISGGVG
ncbi:MAG: LPS export ABC transporter permease LptF [Pseudomonadales bacterium]|nr:LPS export ABC transporter permease LptF [Pseudomonadales bacterium]